MIYKIEHVLEYEFEEPVFFEPHLLYLKPRSDQAQHLLSFEIQIDPKPVLTAESTDAAGNPETRAWFEGLWKTLKIRAVSKVETLRSNPYGFLLLPQCLNLPIAYSPSAQEVLRPFQRDDTSEAAVQSFSDEISREAKGETIAFLNALAGKLSTDFKKINREEGSAWLPRETLSRREGSCRDLSVLFMACCSLQGIASRFVSGYYDGEEEHFHHELHSWVEVYLEGGGWRGFDPMNGIAAGDRHIAIMSAASAENTAPVIGTYRGKAKVTKTSFEVDVRAETP